MHYFWRALDIEKTGRLTTSSIKYFYKDVFECLQATGYEAPSVANIIVEVNDILACNDPLGATFEMFVASGTYSSHTCAYQTFHSLIHFQ